jgi:hypothetical protein
LKGMINFRFPLSEENKKQRKHYQLRNKRERMGATPQEEHRRNGGTLAAAVQSFDRFDQVPFRWKRESFSGSHCQ